MSAIEPKVIAPSSVQVSSAVAELPGTGAPIQVRLEQDAHGQAPFRPRLAPPIAQWVGPSAPLLLPVMPRVAAVIHDRASLEALKRDPESEARYWRAIDEIAGDIRSKRDGRVPYVREILESLRHPDAYDGRGEVASDVYQRIEPATAATPPDDREGRLTEEEKRLLGAAPAEVPQAVALSVGGPTWSRALSSFNNTRIDVALPSGASDYMAYKPYMFGTARTIETLKRIAERHRQQNGLMLRVGDIAKQGGGRIPDHNSHRDGKIFDLDLVFNDGRTTAEPDRDSVNATWRSPAYDRDATRKLIKIIKAIRPEAQILFSDPVLVREGLVRQFTNHDNHLHVQRLN